MLPVRCHHQHADDGCQAGGQHGAEHTHFHREDEYIVENNIEHAGGHGAPHRPAGVVIILYIALDHITQHGDRRKQEQYLSVYFGIGKYLFISTQQTNHRIGKKQADRKEQGGKGEGQLQSTAKELVGLFLHLFPGFKAALRPALQTGKVGTAAYAQHKGNAVDHVVNGQSQIQGRKAIGSQTLGYEKGVHQKEGRHAHHGQHI